MLAFVIYAHCFCYRDIVGGILDSMPPDPTNLEDMCHAALFSGHLTEVLHHASQIDRWLAAHMADIMEALSLIDNDTDEEYVYSILLSSCYLIGFD